MSRELLHERKAHETFQKNLTPRYITLDSLEAYVEGRQYAGMPSWFCEDRPLLDRAPCVVEPIVESALESFGEFLFGDERTPDITASADEDDGVFNDQLALSKDEALVVDRVLKNIIKQADIWAVSSEALQRAMGARSAAGILSVKDGALNVDLEPSKHCRPTFDPSRPSRIVSLEICYPYLEEYWDGAEQKWALQCLLYRRIIDEASDTIFRPVKANEDGSPISAGAWSIHEQTLHGYGFCPIVWYAHKHIRSTRRDYDGTASHERMTDKIDALNRELSMRHRAGLYCGDPTIIETGVSEDEQVGQTGDVSMGAQAYVDEASGTVESPAVQQQNAKYRSSARGAGAGRKKGSSQIWRYGSPNAKAGFLALPGDALKPLDEGAENLRSIIAEALNWVRSSALHESKGLKLNNITATVLTLLFQRQIAECDKLRPDVWRGWIYPLVETALRICLAHGDGRVSGELYLGGLKEITPILKKFEVELAGAEGVKRWFRPPLKPVWPPYFRSTEADEASTSTTVGMDLKNEIITKETAVRMRANFYGISDIEAYLGELKSDVEERHQTELDRNVDEFAKMSKITGANDAGSGSGSKPEKPPQD